LDEETKSVYQVTDGIIQKLEYQRKQGMNIAADLANLRNSIGKKLEDADEVWQLLLDNLPSDFLGARGTATPEEAAIYNTLQIYAICMQGASESVLVDEKSKNSIGESLKAGRDINDSQALDRRFNAMMTAASYDELTYHLRHLIKIVKSKNPMTINFAKLANDLYWIQKGQQKRVCFSWATGYYSGKSDEDVKEGTNNE